MRALVLALASLAFFHTPAAAEEPIDLVLRGGRVIDPETGLDATRDVGIRGGTIVSISETALQGNEVVDVSGLVVAPGFIDLHSHTPTPLGQRLQARDGVTTQLELEAGAYPVEDFGRQLREQPRLHYGASVGYGSVRLEVMAGVRAPHLITDRTQLIGLRGYWTAFLSLFSNPNSGFSRKASASQRREIRELLLDGLANGGIGIGLPLDYFSEGVDDAELRMIFDVAASERTLIFIHLRRGINGDPSGIDEALGLARETGASLHICHIQHNAMGNVDLFLRKIREARADGVDVTTEVLPYNAGSALISSAVFGRDWQTIFNITYSDVEWAATGERFDEAMWTEYRRLYPEGQVVHHYLDEAWTRRALVEPGVIVVSDTLPLVSEDIKAAPHIGAFAKILGRYVRETPLLDLPTALAKMTLLPAQRLETIAPLFARKGRLQVGADADVTVFDPTRIVDRATYSEPFRPSKGIPHVIVGGEFAVRDGESVAAAASGSWLRGPVQEPRGR